jgi:acyl carrier protein
VRRIAVRGTASIIVTIRRYGLNLQQKVRRPRCIGKRSPLYHARLASFPIGKNRLDSRQEEISRQIKDNNVASTFDKVADIIAETSEIDRDTITPESHTIDDLGIDSLDFLDIVFAIDKEFGIKVPLEKWTQEVNDGKVSTDEYFVMKNLCAKIDGLVAAKAASA